MRMIGVVLSVLLLAVPVPVVAASPPPSVAPASGFAAPAAWTPAVDAAGAPLFDGVPVEPVALVATNLAITALVRDAGGTSAIWSTTTTEGRPWTPADMTPFEGARVDGIAGNDDRWLAWSLDGGRPRLWTSLDRVAWTRVPDDRLAPFRGARLASVTGIPDGFIATGTRPVDGRSETRLWVSSFGWRWRERHRFSDLEPGARITVLSPLGHHTVSFGASADGRPRGWVTYGGLRYSARVLRTDVPSGDAQGRLVLTGRDGALVVARSSAPSASPRLWQSVDAWHWSEVPGPPGMERSGGRTAWAAGDPWIVADTVSEDGAHDLRASTDGLRWSAIDGAGGPTDGALPLLALASRRIAMLTPNGIWTSLLDETPPMVAGTQLPERVIAPDPPLRRPVTWDRRDRRPFGRLGRPTASATRDGVTLELWLPRTVLRSGEWITAHVRITNGRSDTITVNCSPTTTVAITSGLFPPGRRWTGNAAEFKRRILDSEWLGRSVFGYRQGDGVDCPGGDVGQDDPIAPGGSLAYDNWALPLAYPGSQALPSGRLPVISTLGWWTADDQSDRRRLQVRAAVRQDGPDWPWPTPQELIDAALSDPFFAAWIASRDDPSWWDNTSAHVDEDGFYARFSGFPETMTGGVQLGLFASSWSPAFGGYGKVLLDPWTAEVLASQADD